MLKETDKYINLLDYNNCFNVYVLMHLTFLNILNTLAEFGLVNVLRESLYFKY